MKGHYQLALPYAATITYVLKLEDDCWFVGSTQNLKANQIISDQFSYGVNDWTRLHRPLKLHSVRAGNKLSEIREKIAVKYGRGKVRIWNHETSNNIPELKQV